MTMTELIMSKKSSAELKGRPFTIIANMAGHSFKLGEKVRYDGREGRYLIMKNDAGTRNTVDKDDVQIISDNKEDLQLLLIEAEKQAQTLRDYAVFLDETKAKELDEAAFKVWKIVKIFQENELEVAKTAIYALLKP